MFKSDRFIKFLVLGALVFVWGFQRIHAEESYMPCYTYPASGLAKPVWFPTKKLESLSSISFSFNIGVGFLYFQKLKGNLTPAPKDLFGNYSGADFGKINKFSYNRTPLFEANIGARIFPWLKTALTYYGQSGVSIESQPNSAIATGSSNNPVWSTFRANLQLYGVLLKCYAELPYSFITGSWATTPYAALGVGASWQSWTNICLYEMTISSGSYSSSVLPLRQKISANVAWTGELGFSFKPATPEAPFSIRIGCKYVDWGQARPMGVLQQQGTKVGPFKPVSVNKVNSLAPFIGVQFNF